MKPVTITITGEIASHKVLYKEFKLHRYIWRNVKTLAIPHSMDQINSALLAAESFAQILN